MLQLASNRTTWILFAVPVLLLAVIGVVADRTASSFAESEGWVSHTHEVQTVIETLRANIFMIQDARKGYVLTSGSENLARYRRGVQAVPVLLGELRKLTADNSDQRERTVQLGAVVNRKLSLLQESIALKTSAPVDTGKQAQFSTESEELTGQITTILSAMVEEENQLLARRVVVSVDTYRRMRIVLAVAFMAVVLFLLITFGRLLVELRNRMRAEGAVRRLSGRILQLQDLERRRIARELHDGVGQYFASSKMTVDGVLNGEALSEAQRKALTEAVNLLEQGIAEARTLSYLLHPPLLDEVSFRAAAEWYINGFAERSKIKVQLTAPDDLESMSKEIELVLFRVLQEALTNIHRHSASPTAEVRIYAASGRVGMEIQDHGRGISRTLLDEFRRRTGTGVGLAGMRERVSEFQGTFDITSEGRGTLVRVEMPLPAPEAENASASGPPNLRSQLDLRTEEGSHSGGGLLLASAPL